MVQSGEDDASGAVRKRIGLVLGPAVFAILAILDPPEGLSPEGMRVAALALFMAIWWVTEAVPLPVTGLLPIVLLPLLGVASVREATAPYAEPLIFLFLGGFVIGLAMERWGLHTRIALTVVRLVGARPDRQVAGFMVATAGLSMWVSNTATTIMMLPIALSVIALADGPLAGDDAGPVERPRSGFAIALLLAVAYSASIGGMATLIGTPPNALLAAFLSQTTGETLGFAQWMTVGAPISVVMLGVAWLWLTRFAFDVPREPIAGVSGLLRERLDSLGPLSRGEKVTAIVFVLTAAAWISRPALDGLLVDASLSDAGIAVAAAVALFVIPVNWRDRVFAMDWDTAKRLPWDVLLLFGGGLSLASAISGSGLAEWLAQALGVFADWPQLLIIAITVTAIIFLTELTSNTATTASFLPLLAAMAPTMGLAPLELMVPAVLAASCAFMMPVATPPNAIIFASGAVTVPQMARTGFALNLFGIVLLSALGYLGIGLILR